MTSEYAYFNIVKHTIIYPFRQEKYTANKTYTIGLMLKNMICKNKLVLHGHGGAYLHHR